MLGLLSHLFLPLVRVGFAALLTLDLRHKSLVLLLVRLILGLLNLEFLARHKVGILAKLSHDALPLLLVLCLQLRQLGPLAVSAVVLVWAESRLLKLGYVRLDGDGAVVVQLKRSPR